MNVSAFKIEALAQEYSATLDELCVSIVMNRHTCSSQSLVCEAAQRMGVSENTVERMVLHRYSSVPKMVSCSDECEPVPYLMAS